MDKVDAEFYCRSIEDLIISQNVDSQGAEIRIGSPAGICPLDKKPCGFVGSCDDILSLALGVDMREGASCPRAVKALKK